MRRPISLIVSVLFCCVAVARAEDVWTLTTSDFATRQVSLHEISGDAVSLSNADASAGKVPMSRVVQLSRVDSTATAHGLVLFVADGQRLTGTPVRIDGANLIWKTEKLGDLSVPLENVLAVLRDRTTTEGLSAVRTEDQAKLQTGDNVRGILTDATADAFVFTPATGDPIRVTPDSVASIMFATPPSGRPMLKPANFLVTVGGSVAACDRLTFARGTFAIERGPSSVDVAASEVRSIEHTGGPVAWLSSRLPIEAIDTPYFDGHRPARMDASVTGNAIQFAGTRYRHGIGVHSRSKLTFAVQPGDRSFRTQYAIDGPLALADVDVRVLLDGKVVHEAKHVRAGQLSPVVETDLGDAKTVSLEVDYGDGYDVQDRLNWIEPAMVRAP